MATIAGGLSETSFLSSFSSSDLTQFTSGLLPTVAAGTTLTMSDLNPIQQWLAGTLYSTYASLGSTVIGGTDSTVIGGTGSTVVGGLSSSDVATLQAFAQYYSLVAQLAFGPLLTTVYGTSVSTNTFAS